MSDDSAIEERCNVWAHGYLGQWRTMDSDLERAVFVRDLEKGSSGPMGEASEACRRALDLITREDPSREGFVRSWPSPYGSAALRDGEYAQFLKDEQEYLNAEARSENPEGEES